MGVMSRRVLPLCGNLCCFCPSMRSRSRQPVKRYKKLLANSFPRLQDGKPNDRMISKLCNYVSKNPMRIPKITEYLEQRCYKEIRNEHFGMAKVVPYIYRKFLGSCKEQMPLYATSVLNVTQTLLEQSRWDDMRILGCHTLVDFLNCQMDNTHMFNLEGIIPKLCQLSQEVGEDDNALRMRSAGLQALASMVHFMGDYSHLSMDFDDIVSATLESYVVNEKKEDNSNGLSCSQHDCTLVEQVPRFLDHVLVDSKMKSLTLDDRGNEKNPTYWSVICLRNMVDLAKEATTLRRVLDPIFRYFDERGHWSPEEGFAQSVLYNMQFWMEKSGNNNHLLLSHLVKHLDHKNVAKRSESQVDIVKVISFLAHYSTLQCSAAMLMAINDLIKQWHKCFQHTIESSKSGDKRKKWNRSLHCALEECIVQLTNKVGDIGPFLDAMTVMLENISLSTEAARATLTTVYHIARIIASLPRKNDAFPEALFYQLLLIMTHPDHETSIGSHRIFCAILVPMLIVPCSAPSLSISVDTYSPEDIVSKKMEHFPAGNGLQNPNAEKIWDDGFLQFKIDIRRWTEYAILEGEDLTSLHLSGHQVDLLLSSIWVQLTSSDNTPADYEAITHTFNLALVFSQKKASSRAALVRCFQLALSLRSLSLDDESSLPPYCRRSLFTTAFSMLIFSAKAGKLMDTIPFIKSNFAAEMGDPHLYLIEDSMLLAMNMTNDGEKKVYGTHDDMAGAVKFLSAIKNDSSLLKETIASHLLNKFGNLAEEELLGIKEQLMQKFSPDGDAFPHGAPLFMETPRRFFPFSQKQNESSNQIIPFTSFDVDMLPEGFGSDHKQSESLNTSDILNVNQLIESVLESTRQVARLPTSTASVPYDQMKNQCEALVVGKQEKMSVLLSLKQKNDVFRNDLIKDNEDRLTFSERASQFAEEDLLLGENDPKHSAMHSTFFRLPPSSPYDKFMRAAGC